MRSVPILKFTFLLIAALCFVAQADEEAIKAANEINSEVSSDVSAEAHAQQHYNIDLSS